MSELNHQKKRPRKRTSVINFQQASLNQVVPEDDFVDNLHIHSDNASAVPQLDAKQEEFQRAFRRGSVIGILPLDAYSLGSRSDTPTDNDKLYISRHAAKEWYIIRHDSWIVDTLHVVAALCAIWNLMEVPVDIAFQYSMVYSYGTSFDIVVDVLVWLYIAVLFFVTVITSNDIELTDLKDIAAYRVASKSVWIDVLTSLPYEFLWSSLNLDAPESLRESYATDVAIHVMIQLLRLPKILRAANTLRSSLKARQKTSLIWSLIKLILIYMIVLHFWACGLYFVGMYQIGPDDPKGRVRWVDLTGLSNSETPLMYQYTLSLYWSLIVITGTGFGDITAVTLNEKMFMILCLSCTVTTSALLFSGLFSIIEKMDAQNAAKQTYKEELMTYLELERVDKSIVGTLLDNTEMYLSEEFIESSIIVERTPVLFQNRIHRAVYLDPLSTFALTNILSERCRHALCNLIKIEVACVDELLSEVGDVQTQLYMIMRGAVSVTDPEKGIEYGLLKRGGFFGELAMMSGENLPKCRAPTLKATENCCFATISRSKLRTVLSAFSDDALLLEKIALCRARIFKHNTLPILEPHEKSALFLMNVVAAIGSSNSQASGDRESNDTQAVRDSEPQLLARRSRAAKRFSQDNSSSSTNELSKFDLFLNKSRIILTSTVPESNRRRKQWEGLVCIGVMFWVIMAPMDMAFGIYDEGYKSRLVSVRWFFDAVFFMDMILSFFFENKTSNLNRHALSYKEVQIAYLQRGFFLDLITTIPYDYISALNILVGDQRYQKHLVHIPPVFLFLRLFRLRKLIKWFNNINFKDLFAMQALRLSKLLIAYYIFLHWSACILLMLGRQQTEGNPVSGRNPWFIDQGICFSTDGDTSSPFTDPSTAYYFKNLANATNFPGAIPPLRRECGRMTDVKTQYITTLYWMTIMFTTIGYGEIVPTTLPEIFCLIVVLFFSSIANVSITGNVTNIIASAGGGLKQTQQKLKMKILDCLKKDDFTPEHSENAKMMLNLMISTNNLLQTRDMLSQIPTHIRKQIMKKMYLPVLRGAFMFRGSDPEFLALLCCSVRVEVALAKQTIQKHGGRSKSFYVIIKGIVNIVDSTRTVVYTQLSRSSHFGELNLFYEKSNLFTAVAHEDCIFMVWTQDTLDEALEYFPHYRALFHEACERRIEKLCWILTEKVRSETLEVSVADRCKKEITFQNQ